METIYSAQILQQSSPQFYIGLIVGVVIALFVQILVHLLAASREEKNREEIFKLKIFELKLEAAQTAYKLIYRVSRGERDNVFQRGPDLDTAITDTRDWIEGQRLILGNRIYEDIIEYLKLAEEEDPDAVEAFENAKHSLEKVVKKEQAEKFGFL